jgi:hypothetical protein
MATALDVVLLLAIARESLTLAPSLPIQTWAAFVIGLPFCLGMGSSLRAGPGCVQNYVRVAVGQGLTLMTTVIYFSMLIRRGLDQAFVSLFVVALLLYGLGRLFGLTLKSLVLLGAVVVAVLALMAR